MNNHVSFPGLGIGDLELDPIVFSFHIGDREFSVAWYGLIITFGIVCAFLYVWMRLKKQGLVFDDLIDIALFTVIPGVIGARLYYVFFYEMENPGTYTSFGEVIAVWNGGLAIYGGIIFGALGALVTLIVKKIRIPAFFDALGPAVMLAQAIGRWGNFMNCEAYGGETTLPWRMQITFANGVVETVHPTFLYESLWNLVGFVGICLVYYVFFKKKFDGQIILTYFAWYGFGRGLIEGLRQDSLYLGRFRVSQLVGFLAFAAAGGAILVISLKLGRERRTNGFIYRSGAKLPPEMMPEAAIDELDRQVVLFDLIPEPDPESGSEQTHTGEENGKID